MNKSSVLVASVALFLMTLSPTTASAGGARVYVGPGYGYDYPRYRDDYPRYRDGYDYPRGYTVYRVPKRYVRRRARRYWRGW